MSANVRATGWPRSTVFVLLVLIATGSLVAGDAAKPPSADEKQAVALLAQKGSVIFIDGDYQVTQVLGGRDLTNDDLQHLRFFKKLTSLSLSQSKVTSVGIDTLKSLTQLQSLNLPAGALSESEQQALRKALPNCRIISPDRRSPGTPGNKAATSATGPASGRPGPPMGWGTFEFPPLTPAPSISSEIRSTVVQDRLKLSPEQLAEIEKVTGRDFQRQQTETAIKKLLTAEQQVLLQQVLLQREGPTALVLPDVAQDLKLTTEQRATIKTIMDERRKQLMSIGDQLRERKLDFPQSTQETNRINAEINPRLLSALTAKQLAAWNAKIGPPLPAAKFGGFQAGQTPEESARSIFRNLDRNSDGQLTEEEWHRSRSTRTRFENAKIELRCPTNVDAFVKSFLQLEAGKSRPNP